MIRYLLDTDTCISYMRGAAGVRDKLEEVGFDQCVISVITLAELKFGAENSSRPGFVCMGIGCIVIAISPALILFGIGIFRLVQGLISQ